MKRALNTAAPATLPPLRRDALVLALQWPPARLQGNPLLSAEYGGAMAEGRVASSWTIHGLWPSSGNGPTYCGPSGGKRTRAIRHPGAEPALVPTALVPSLNYMWPDITPGQPITSSGGQPLSIWQEEWATHGTCYSSDSATYLLDAVRVAVGIRNLTDVLAGAGIVPSASRPYRGKCTPNRCPFNCTPIQLHPSPHTSGPISLCLQWAPSSGPSQQRWGTRCRRARA